MSADLHAPILAEIHAAMAHLNAHPLMIETVTDEATPEKLYLACAALGARSDLLSIVGSYRDTMDDEWVLNSLKHWNMRADRLASDG